MGQYCFARWRLSASIFCRLSSFVTLPPGVRAVGRPTLHDGQLCYMLLLVCIYGCVIMFYSCVNFFWSQLWWITIYVIKQENSVGISLLLNNYTALIV